MFTGIIIATGRLVSIVAKGGDLELGVDAAALDAGRMQPRRQRERTGSVPHGDPAGRPGILRRCIARDPRQDHPRDAEAGARVNLEPSLRGGDPLGGHLVSGHVDAVGTVTAMHADARSWRLQFELPAPLMRYVAPKGSICIDGVSLTVNEVGGQRFDVNIIPHTHEVTSLGELTSAVASTSRSMSSRDTSTGLCSVPHNSSRREEISLI